MESYVWDARFINKGFLWYRGGWITALKGTKPVQIELAPIHDYDEVLGFAGSEIFNLDDLGG